MYIDLTNAQREEIISFLRQETIPARFEVQIYKDSFKRKARKFIYLCNTNELRYKKTSVQYLRFFTTQESVSKKDFILLQHNTNGHAGRDRLFGHIQNLAYVIARAAIDQCAVCQAKRTLVTRPILRPIIAVTPRERYIVDLRYYSDLNNGLKWRLSFVSD